MFKHWPSTQYVWDQNVHASVRSKGLVDQKYVRVCTHESEEFINNEKQINIINKYNEY